MTECVHPVGLRRMRVLLFRRVVCSTLTTIGFIRAEVLVSARLQYALASV